MKRNCALATTVIALAVGIFTDRVDAQPETSKLLTNDGWTVPHGMTEVLISYAYGRARSMFDDAGEEVYRSLFDLHVPYVSVTHGFYERVDLGVDALWARMEDADISGEPGGGFGDMSVFLKWTFAAPNDDAYAWVSGFTIPTGTQPTEDEPGPGLGFFLLNQSLVASIITGSFITNFETGIRVPIGEGRGAQRGLFYAGAAAGWQALSWLQPEVELHVAVDFLHDQPDVEFYGTTVGALLNLAPWIRVDTGVQFSVFGRNTDELTTGILQAAILF